MKSLLLIFLMSGAWAQDSLEKGRDVVLYQAFSTTIFGVKSRTKDTNDAFKVKELMKSFLLTHPKAVVSRVEIITCTSDYELPKAIIAEKMPNEHLDLARRRHEMVVEHFKQTYSYPIQGEYKICGLKFRREDLDDRFVVKESGEIYEKKFKALLSDPEYRHQLKEEALIEEPESVKSIYPSPFLAKYKPFQGIRLIIWGHEKESIKQKIDSKQPSGKNQ